ncbi:MAG: hypothetical protein ACJ76W_06490 [Chloroflexota bacterium]
MTASEFAFLAIGLVLGVASGAALIEVLRARPPASREIRVTVAPNAIQGRRSATLSEQAMPEDASGPARFGPGDRRLVDDHEGAPSATAPGRRIDDRGPSSPRSGAPEGAQPDRTSVPDTASGRDGSAAAPLPGTVAPPRRGEPLWLRPAAGASGADFVAVPMSMEPDPLTTALRATAAMAAVSSQRDGERGARTTPPKAGTAVVETQDRSPTSVATSFETWAADERPSGSSEASATTGGATGQPAAGAPCADERRVSDERCAVAALAREGAATAAETLRRAQRSYDDLVSRAEEAAAAADPRAVRSAKEEAQRRFRDARTGAGTRDDVETGAREWLAEINRINHDTREAALAAERDRAAAAQIGSTLERLSVQADAARIAAERADEACIAAREAVAACDEAVTLASAAPVAVRTTPVAGPAEAPAGPRIAAATPDPDVEFAFSTPMRSSEGHDAPILRILRGDNDALQRTVARLAGDDTESGRRWQTQLGALADALIARSIEAAAFDFPVEHPFWGAFSQSENRDIAAALSSLGYRFDGYGGWVEDRVPSQRDLSLAVGYAGQDPMRIRRWPNEAEMRDLLQDVRVAADEYIAGAAGGLSLGELLTLLGPRADTLTELWNDWGRVRPILLEAD